MAEFSPRLLSSYDGPGHQVSDRHVAVLVGTDQVEDEETGSLAGRHEDDDDDGQNGYLTGARQGLHSSCLVLPEFNTHVTHSGALVKRRIWLGGPGAGCGTPLPSSSLLAPRLHVEQDRVISSNPHNDPPRHCSCSHFTDEAREAWGGRAQGRPSGLPKVMHTAGNRGATTGRQGLCAHTSLPGYGSGRSSAPGGALRKSSGRQCLSAACQQAKGKVLTRGEPGREVR